MSELSHTLHQLTLAQYLLALVFLLGYGTALGAMFGPAGRLRALLLALLSGAGFAALTQPWEQGVLLVLCAIGGIGLFIAVAWTFSAITAPGRWSSAPQTAPHTTPSSAPPAAPHPGRSPELRDAAARAVARTARAVKRRRRARHRTT